MRNVIGLVVAVLVLGYVVFAWATVDRRGDEVRIAAMIQRAARAVQARQVGTIISCVSQDYRDDSELNRDGLRLLLTQALWDEPRYKCRARIEKLTVTGDTAEAQVHATVTSLDSGDTIYNRTVTLLFLREDGRHALIMPVKIWRAIGSRNAALDFESMMQ